MEPNVTNDVNKITVPRFKWMIKSEKGIVFCMNLCEFASVCQGAFCLFANAYLFHYLA